METRKFLGAARTDYLDAVAEDRKVAGIVREYAVSKLAQILYECVECNKSPRDKLDWETAESIMGDKYSEVGRLLCLKVYEIERTKRKETSSEELPPISSEIINCLDGGYHHYTGILRLLSTLDINHFKNLLDKAAEAFSDEQTRDWGFMDLVLSRPIWNFWQYWKYNNAVRCGPKKSKLPPEYGEILFH